MHSSRKRSALITALTAILALSGCASVPGHQATAPVAVTPLDQYALTATTDTQAINLRINPNGLSDNQIRALDQLATRAGSGSDVQIITAPNPTAVAAGQAVSAYLARRDISRDHLSLTNADAQPGDVITLVTTSYQASAIDCNQTWGNMAATGNNKPYANFGCAVTANLAAQIADPRDLTHPAPAASPDAARRNVVLDKYRKGEVTGSATDTAGKGTISDAIK